MIIQSDILTEGLFGQVFIWMLEILPYLDSKGWKPAWQIRTRNYGRPPEFNIFPDIVRTSYEPEPGAESLSFEQLKFYHKFNFRYDFQGAHRYWNSYFRFTEDVHDRLERFWHENFAGETVLGVHYRGTDKNADPWETNPVSRQQFLCVVEDFLKSHSEITAVFAASDDEKFIEALSGFPRVRYHRQLRSQDNRPLHMCDQRQVADRIALAKDAILDSLTLSRCHCVLKCMSQLSAFCKIFNPDIEVYRVAACKPDWFPEAYIPLYRGRDRAVRALLSVLQDGDAHASVLAKTAGAPKRFGRLAAQAWRVRGTLAKRARTVLLGR